jgi:ABC-type amino acid transport substrate-binding protein
MVNKSIIKILAVLLAAFMMLAFAACSGGGAEKPGADMGNSEGSAEQQQPAPADEGGPIMTKIKETGKIILGTSADYAPYEFHKMIDGEDHIVGFDIEIAKEIAKGLGAELDIKEIAFDGLLAALQLGKVDFVIAGMTPDEERKKEVDFTKIYYMAQQGVVIRAEDADKIKTIEDLNGKKVGAQRGAIQEDIAREQITGAEVKALAKVPDLVLELEHGKIDAIVMELPVANEYIKRNTKLALSEVQVEDDTGGSAVAIAKGNEDLVEKMNEILDALIAEGKIDQFVAEAIEMVENE